MKSLFTLLFTALLGTADAQTVQWMKQGGLSGEGRGVSSDALDNAYVCGTVGNPALFDEDTTASHFADAFIAKYDDAGTIQWVRTGGGSLIDQANDIVTDAGGNSYVTGFFNTNFPNPTVDFAGNVITGLGSEDLFLAKYDANGALLWIRYGGGTQAEEGRGVELAADGNVVVSGFFQGTAVFGNDTLVSAGLSDILLLKYDPQGNLLWSMRAGGAGDDQANKLTACPNGDVAVVGAFQGSFVLGGNTIVSSGLYNVFLSRIAANGTALWSASAGSTNASVADQAFDITCAANGDLVFCGEIAGTALFDGLSVVPNGGRDIVIARYDGSGAVQWVHHAGGPQTDHAYGVAVDADGNSYLTGQADSGANTVFDSITLAPFGNEAVFLAKYDPAGGVQWVERYAPGQGRAIALLGSGCLYFTGGASGIVGEPAFDTIPWQYVDRAIFTALFCEDIGTQVDAIVKEVPLGHVYPDPANEYLSIPAFAPGTTITITDLRGNVVYAHAAVGTIRVTEWPEGYYILRTHGPDGATQCSSFIVIH
ncbi:MAG: SBBP repeat-containing protein [Flavobacteriales bacterium]